MAFQSTPTTGAGDGFAVVVLPKGADGAFEDIGGSGADEPPNVDGGPEVASIATLFDGSFSVGFPKVDPDPKAAPAEPKVVDGPGAGVACVELPRGLEVDDALDETPNSGLLGIPKVEGPVDCPKIGFEGALNGGADVLLVSELAWSPPSPPPSPPPPNRGLLCIPGLPKIGAAAPPPNMGVF